MVLNRMIFPGSVFIIGGFLTIFQIIPYGFWTPTAEDKSKDSFVISQWSDHLGQSG